MFDDIKLSLNEYIQAAEIYAKVTSILRIDIYCYFFTYRCRLERLSLFVGSVLCVAR